MSDKTRIEWTDATWNIVTGCSVISPGCTNCYAMRLAGKRLKNHPSRAGLTSPSKAGPVWNGETRVNWDWLEQPLNWARPRTIFPCAHGDLFHESVAMMVIAQIYGVMIAAHHLRGHRFQVLTKRASRAREILNDPEFWRLANSDADAHVMERVDPLNRRSDDARATLDDYGLGSPPPGIWLGVSVEDQQRADERVPHLLATPAAVRWLSCEPLLGPVDLTALTIGNDAEIDALRPLTWATQVEEWRGTSDTWEDDFEDWFGRRPDEVSGLIHPALDWIIAGGESGQGARPMHPDWARGLRDQCADAGVPFFFKQWGEWAPQMFDTDSGIHPDACYTPDGQPRFATCAFHVDGQTRRVAEPGTAFLVKCGKKRGGRLLDGVEHNAMPEARP